jgi:hypothetical protein
VRRRIKCPYRWCSKGVAVLPAPPYPGTDGPGSQLIAAHDIGHPVLTGTCPASNMHYPLTPEAAQHLRDQERADSRRIPGLVVDSAPERPGWFLQRHPESRSLRQPGRMGREPEPASDDWALGGREDEDSGKTKPPNSPPRTPEGVAGQEVGRHVASVDELVGMTRQVQLLTGEGMGTLQGVRDELDIASSKIEAALTELSILQGSATSETLGSMHEILTQAGTDVRSMVEQAEEITNALGASQEHADAFIGRLLS